jgi:hypothetical protein
MIYLIFHPNKKHLSAVAASSLRRGRRRRSCGLLLLLSCLALWKGGLFSLVVVAVVVPS